MIKYLFLAAVAALCTPTASAAMPPEQADAWREDISQYAQDIEASHIDLYHAISKKKFTKTLADLEASLPETSEQEVVVALMRLTRRVGDGHTSFPLWGSDYSRAPLALELIDGRLLIVAASDDFADLLGGEVVSVNDAPVERVVAAFSDIVPFVENEFSEDVRIAQYILTPKLLAGLGFSEVLDVVNVGVKTHGVVRSVTLKPIPRATYGDVVTNTISYRNDDAFEKVHGHNDTLWFGASGQGKTVYIRFDRYPSFEEMSQFGEVLFSFLDENKTENIIIDLRENFGGDFFVGLELAAYLVLMDSIDWQSGVYTLTSNKTFSAAMSNSAQFRQILNTRLVGQPTGGRPCGYQDMGQFNLAHSGFLVTYSKRRYCFQTPRARAVFPDVEISPEADDYANGIDRVLDWVRSDIEKRAENSAD